jgi:hypothetical protein
MSTQRRKPIFIITICAITAACGPLNKGDHAPLTAATDDPSEMVGKATYEQGTCQGDSGCIKGFISHGMRLTLTPKDGGINTTVDGRQISLEARSFHDAQDFGDRFDTAFLVPLLPEGKRGDYNITVTPTVRRDNFAAGFELYAEGDEASDQKLAMHGEGNFVLGDMKPFDQAMLRVVKTFRIDIERSQEASDNTPAVTRKVTCLEVEAIVGELKIRAAEATSVGGLRNFNFYYTESDELCRHLTSDGTHGQSTAATSLPPVGPHIP